RRSFAQAARAEASGGAAGPTRRRRARRGAQHRGLATKVFEPLGGNVLLRLGHRSAEGDAVAGERELDFLPRLVDPPLDGRERNLERVGDLGIGESDHVAEEQRHLQVRSEERRVGKEWRRGWWPWYEEKRKRDMRGRRDQTR